MSELRQRIEPIRSRRYLDGAKGYTSRGATARWLADHAGYDGDECLLWPFARRSNGYGMATVNGKLGSAHRLMCELANGAPPTASHHAAHSCGNGHLGCVNPRHLSWKTRLANKADELSHGTRNRGERCGSAKLTRAQVVEMRSRHAMGGVSIAALAREFEIHEGTAREVIRRMTWSWL